jgi:hypothetical protein
LGGLKTVVTIVMMIAALITFFLQAGTPFGIGTPSFFLPFGERKTVAALARFLLRWLTLALREILHENTS